MWYVHHLCHIQGMQKVRGSPEFCFLKISAFVFFKKVSCPFSHKGMFEGIWAAPGHQAKLKLSSSLDTSFTDLWVKCSPKTFFQVRLKSYHTHPKKNSWFNCSSLPSFHLFVTPIFNFFEIILILFSKVCIGLIILMKATAHEPISYPEKLLINLIENAHLCMHTVHWYTHQNGNKWTTGVSPGRLRKKKPPVTWSGLPHHSYLTCAWWSIYG